jgi:hypothetical protein
MLRLGIGFLLWVSLCLFWGRLEAEVSECKKSVEGLPSKVNYFGEFEKEARHNFQKIDNWMHRGSAYDNATRFPISTDSHFRWLKKMGFKILLEHPHTRLVPPKNPSLIFRVYHDTMKAYVKAGLVKESEIIYPTIALERIADKKAFFFRPGLDPFPSPVEFRWVAYAGTFTHRVWAEQMANGRRLLDLDGAIDHDLGHLTHDLEWPTRMAAEGRFYRQNSSYQSVSRVDQFSPEVVLGRRWKVPDSFWMSDKRRKATLLYYQALYLFEFGSHPDIEKAHEIKSLLPEHFQSPELIHWEVHQKYLGQLSDKALDKKIREFLSKAPKLLLKQGAALRDSFNTTRYMRRQIFNDFLTFGGPWNQRPIDYGQSEDVLMARSSLPSILMELQLGLELSRDTQRVLDEFEDSAGISFLTRSWRLSDFTQDQNAWRNFLITRLAILETAFANAVKLQLRPEDIIDEIGQVDLDPSTRSYRYFQSHLPSESFLREVLFRAN